MVSVRRLGLAGSCTFSIGLISYGLGFSAMLKSQVKSQIRLKNGSEMRDFWEKLPQPLDFKIYAFNVTNPDQIKSGAKPIVQEVGPFHYDLYRNKEKIVDREEDDSVEYSLRQVWHFNSEKSVMSEEASIYTFHPIMLALVLVTQREKPNAMGVVSKAFKSIFNNPESMFIKITVRELFFYGVRFDCTVKDFSGSAVCSALKEKEHILIKEDELIYRFGYLAKANGTYLPDRIRVSRGIKNHEDVGRVLSMGDSRTMNVWPGKPCNNFRGTDGTIFPPFLTKDKKVWAHFPDLCRSIAAYYVEPGMVQGFNTLHYTADLGDPSTDKDVRCLCLKPEGCMPKNVFNADPCKSVPIMISLPHLYDSDPRYYEMVDGLSPDPKKHMMIFDFDEMTGTPIRAYKKIQFNAMVGPIRKLQLMESFPNALFPLFWVEDGIELGDILIKPLKVAYMQIFIAKILMWFIMLSGVGTMIAAMVKYYKEKRRAPSVALSKGSRDRHSSVPSHQKPTVSIIQPGPVPPSID